MAQPVMAQPAMDLMEVMAQAITWALHMAVMVALLEAMVAVMGVMEVMAAAMAAMAATVAASA